MISSVCPICGVIKRSGKMSCCSRGGSWFGKCGSTGNAKLDHTWYEGLQACKVRSQSETGRRQQLHDAKQEGNASSNDKAVIEAAKPFVFTSAPMAHTAPISTPHTHPNTSTAYATFTANSNRIAATVLTTISMTASMPTRLTRVRTVNTSLTPLARISTTQNSGKMPVIIPVYASITSQGCKQWLDFAAQISFSLTVAFF